MLDVPGVEDEPRSPPRVLQPQPRPHGDVADGAARVQTQRGSGVRTIHIVNVNLDPVCGEDRPTHWAATALTLEAALAMAQPHDQVCEFCRLSAEPVSEAELRRRAK